MSDWSEEYRRGYIHGKSKGIKKGLKMRKDYVHVVRCKDCLRYYNGRNGWTCGLTGFTHKEDWYCADGDRKDDE